ncbi:MAG: NAD(P)H-dependent oxidoreductase [Alphaproteobacteria bacterium]|nr:NAD(P)H-dependent oxidoreductase [Alphaproteobacteria bacterium]MBU1575470.1 NAD(P)H-dependent oxidoreductase [Alphaproteobacteria bacterium]MBU1830595.1 NAD(P)H-dependent oxidoreductase [Alphaproteobacteria bacterium]MBU2077491.1 NAD(P)H-dependent oxidoreductase [Alphaproteobacteria bacterium]MBU2160876.1 NAD(P)H-dependent oxidoreductase [Alphaproteobacteria bacterium]
MTNVLALRSSILGDASASNQLINETIASLRAQEPTIRIIERDLVTNPIPHFDGDAANGLRQDPLNTEQRKARALSDALIQEVQAADILLIGAPMYNFGIPSALKSWFDYVLRAGVTFRYSETGPEGLLTGKSAVVVLTRGGSYSDGPASAMDAQAPHLRALLGFVGITDQKFVLAEKLALGPEERKASMGLAKDKIIDAFQIALAERV